MKFLFTILSFILVLSINAKTYTANTPAWRGEWIWGPRKPDAPVMTVNLREWLEERPGGWGQALVNRILGNAIVSGVSRVYWRLDDGKGNALFPYTDKKKVLSWPNWGVDFNEFDFPAAAAEFAKRCDMKITFWTPDCDFYTEAKKLYSKLDIRDICTVSGNAVNARKLLPRKTAKKWLNWRVYEFKKEFEVSGKISKARLCITADSSYQLYIDGKLVGSDGDWWRGETYDMTSLLSPGKHSLKAIVKPSREYSGLLVNLEWRDSKGKLHQLNTGSDWLCRPKGEKKWQNAAVVGFEGCGPRFRLKDVWRNPRIPNCVQKKILKTVEISEYKSINKALDGSHSTFWKGKGAGATLTLTLKRPLWLTEIRVYSGCLTNYSYPSGACALKDYRIQYFENGNWKDLTAPVKNALDYQGEEPENFRNCHAFTPRKVRKIRLVIDRSHDTLKRNTGPIPASQMTGIIREIKLIKALGE